MPPPPRITCVGIVGRGQASGVAMIFFFQCGGGGGALEGLAFSWGGGGRTFPLSILFHIQYDFCWGHWGLLGDMCPPGPQPISTPLGRGRKKKTCSCIEASLYLHKVDPHNVPSDLGRPGVVVPVYQGRTEEEVQELGVVWTGRICV